MSLDRDIEFLYEMGTLRLLQRQWRRFLSPDFANLAEHHFRVSWIALVIASRESKKRSDIDIGKVLGMAMMHDITESRTNDVDYISRQYVTRNEKLGIEDMASGTTFNEELLKLWHEYEVRTSIEARIVKDADNLDVEFELYEQRARGMAVADTKLEMREGMLDKYFTKTALEMVAALKTSNPHDWHLNGRNRHSSGDWKPAEKPVKKPKAKKPKKA